MNWLNKIKIVWSYVTDKPVPIGYGVTTDSTICIPRDSGIDLAEGNSIHRGTYFKLKRITGPFELVGFAKSGDKVLYQLRHDYTGETFNVTRAMLEFLFERSNQ